MKDIWDDLDFASENIDTGELLWPEALKFSKLFKHLPPNLRD